YTWLGYAGRGALAGDTDAVWYGLLALGLLAAIALLPRLIKRLRGKFDWIEANELKRRLDRGEGVTIGDDRGRAEFVGPLGHIATARNIPVAELESRLSELAGLERGPIVLVCRTDKRSATAARTLGAAGFTQVNALRRGMEEWNETGLPAQARAAQPTAASSAGQDTAFYPSNPSIWITTRARRSIRAWPPQCARFLRTITAIHPAGIGRRPREERPSTARAARSRRCSAAIMTRSFSQVAA